LLPPSFGFEMNLADDQTYGSCVKSFRHHVPQEAPIHRRELSVESGRVDTGCSWMAVEGSRSSQETAIALITKAHALQE